MPSLFALSDRPAAFTRDLKQLTEQQTSHLHSSFSAVNLSQSLKVKIREQQRLSRPISTAQVKGSSFNLQSVSSAQVYSIKSHFNTVA